jgi:hypothetical protein
MDATATPQSAVSSPVSQSKPLLSVSSSPSPVTAISPSLPISTTSVVPAKPAMRRTRSFFQLSKIGDYVQAWGGIAFFAMLGIALWRADAHFTLWFFAGWMPSIMASLGPAQWIIPVLFSLGQLYFFVGPTKLKTAYAARVNAAQYPDHEPSYRVYTRARKKLFRHTMGFLAVSIINVGTSAQGMYEWAAGRTINLFGGFTLPQPGVPLRITCLILGVVLAFGAEKAFKAAWDEYKER